MRRFAGNRSTISAAFAATASSRTARSEDPTPANISKPPRNRHLLVGVELERVAPVHLQVAEKAVARAAEWEVGHGRGHADVHADHGRRRPTREFARRLAARRED